MKGTYYNEEGQIYRFDSKAYRDAVDLYRNQHANLKFSAIFGMIERRTQKAVSSINAKNWYYGDICPREAYETLYHLSEALDMPPGAFLVKIDGTEKDAAVGLDDFSMIKKLIDFSSVMTVKRSLYMLLTMFIDEFRRTRAFEDVEIPRSSRRAEFLRKCVLVCGFDLPDEIYQELLAFADMYLMKMEYYDECGDGPGNGIPMCCGPHELEYQMKDAYVDHVADLAMRRLKEILSGKDEGTGGVNLE